MERRDSKSAQAGNFWQARPISKFVEEPNNEQERSSSEQIHSGGKDFGEKGWSEGWAGSGRCPESCGAQADCCDGWPGAVPVSRRLAKAGSCSKSFLKDEITSFFLSKYITSGKTELHNTTRFLPVSAGFQGLPSCDLIAPISEQICQIHNFSEHRMCT